MVHLYQQKLILYSTSTKRGILMLLEDLYL